MCQRSAHARLKPGVSSKEGSYGWNIWPRPSQFKCLVWGWQFHVGIRQEFCKRLHGRYFTVDEECGLHTGYRVAPCEQPLLVSVGREPRDRVDSSLDRNVLVKEANHLRAVHNSARWCSRRGIADEDNARFGSPEIVLQVMPNATAGRHTRSRHDDGAARYLIDGHRIRGF